MHNDLKKKNLQNFSNIFHITHIPDICLLFCAFINTGYNFVKNWSILVLN